MHTKSMCHYNSLSVLYCHAMPCYTGTTASTSLTYLTRTDQNLLRHTRPRSGRVAGVPVREVCVTYTLVLWTASVLFSSAAQTSPPKPPRLLSRVCTLGRIPANLPPSGQKKMAYVHQRPVRPGANPLNQYVTGVHTIVPP